MTHDSLSVEWWERQRATLALGLITLLGFGLRFYAIGAKTLWLDEAFSIWLAQQPLMEMWAWLIKIDQHPPLYYSLLHYWILLFGDAQGSVRALSALCSGLVIPFFYGTCRYLLTQPTALLATLLLAISPFHIRYAQEARMYALLTFTAAIALYLFAVVLFDERARRREWPWLGLALAQAAVMLTHNTATVFFPLALNSVIGGALLWKRWQGKFASMPILQMAAFERRWLRTQLLAIAGWLPWSAPFVIQSMIVDREFWIGPPTVGLLYETLHNFNLAFLPAWSLPIMVMNLGWWLLAALGVYTLRRMPARAFLLLALFCLPILGELVVSLRRPIFADRTLIWVTLPYLMLVAAGMAKIGGVMARWAAHQVYRINSAAEAQPIAQMKIKTVWRQLARVGRILRCGCKRPASEDAAYRGGVHDLPNDLLNLHKRVAMYEKIAAIVGVVLMLGLSGLALHNYYRYFEKEGWAEAAGYVAEQMEPGDLILFNATWVQLPFQYYFRHADKSADLRGLPVDLFDRGLLEPKMSETDLPYMRTLLADRERVWLIYSHDWYTDPQGLIPRELQQTMALVEQQPFTGLQVLRFQRE